MPRCANWTVYKTLVDTCWHEKYLIKSDMWANMCKQDSKIIFDFIQNESNILQADVNVFPIDPHCHYI